MAEALKRRIGLGLLTAYGVGVMVGAGIYVMVGAVAGAAGVWAPLGFLVAGLIAVPSALSYAELSTRIPEAAGEAAFVQQGLGLRWLSVAVGLAIVLAGLVSAAAVLRGGTGYLVSVLPVPFTPALLMLGAGLVLVAVLGVLESLLLAAVFTVVELAGLVLVIYAGMQAVPVADWSAPPDMPFTGLALAALLAFFAFIGFEDIVNMAEEVDNPVRTLPRAILLSLVITSLVYVGVAVAAVRAVPAAELASTERPLALVWARGTGGDPAFLSMIAVFAALNGVLAQIVMAARVLFGLGRHTGWLAIFHHAHPRFGTPFKATVLVGAGVLAAALALPVAVLAGMTSGVLLVVFALVNLSLIRLKQRAPEAAFRVGPWVPWLGLLTALGALALSLAGLV
ncbi:amino acid/polyamine/organocation transporter (APC superfamily) [Rhodovulum bhavnagarense]|uniref:Amino acid/polyamine/organocation transporter (APC superfamily) n=1 Tax=Rhodovulum bhavnagarense TaxID=992286 RepID=A0A4V2SWI8_9RHOB|nr:APC family permease [Rhodovulum bhavnagarense]TCP62396.1 amino acid/polyamine/organocation transporter (APC superfamily) [Rhodovulum bhavnagarense]